MTLDKCAVLQIRTITGCPQFRKIHALFKLKNPIIILICSLVGFHPATGSVQSTAADNTREGVRQYIEIERKSEQQSQ